MIGGFALVAFPAKVWETRQGEEASPLDTQASSSSVIQQRHRTFGRWTCTITPVRVAERRPRSHSAGVGGLPGSRDPGSSGLPAKGGDDHDTLDGVANGGGGGRHRKSSRRRRSVSRRMEAGRHGRRHHAGDGQRGGRRLAQADDHREGPAEQCHDLQGRRRRQAPQ
jgi:hypothetical protein